MSRVANIIRETEQTLERAKGLLLVTSQSSKCSNLLVSPIQGLSVPDSTHNPPGQLPVMSPPLLQFQSSTVQHSSLLSADLSPPLSTRRQIDVVMTCERVSESVEVMRHQVNHQVEEILQLRSSVETLQRQVDRQHGMVTCLQGELVPQRTAKRSPICSDGNLLEMKRVVQQLQREVFEVTSSLQSSGQRTDRKWIETVQLIEQNKNLQQQDSDKLHSELLSIKATLNRHGAQLKAFSCESRDSVSHLTSVQGMLKHCQDSQEQFHREINMEINLLRDQIQSIQLNRGRGPEKTSLPRLTGNHRLQAELDLNLSEGTLQPSLKPRPVHLGDVGHAKVSAQKSHKRPARRRTVFKPPSFLAKQYSQFILPKGVRHGHEDSESSSDATPDLSLEVDSIQAEEERLLSTLEQQTADLQAKLSSYSSLSSPFVSSSSLS